MVYRLRSEYIFNQNKISTKLFIRSNRINPPLKRVLSVAHATEIHLRMSRETLFLEKKNSPEIGFIPQATRKKIELKRFPQFKRMNQTSSKWHNCLVEQFDASRFTCRISTDVDHPMWCFYYHSQCVHTAQQQSMFNNHFIAVVLHDQKNWVLVLRLNQN